MSDSLALLASPAARSHVNAWWGAATAEILVRLGVETVVISPGSRSTPLTVACARHPQLTTPVILDERSAAFFALGLAKVRQCPVALLCTSGTAVANYLPAVIEARESGVPLVVLSADRPPELRLRHAGQTIDQVKLFGDAVRFFGEAPVPEGRLEVLRAWRDLLSQAVAHTHGSAAGPVHLNCPFREPLAPGTVEDPSLPVIEATFFRHLGPPVLAERRVRLVEDWAARGWIIAGPASPKDPGAYAAAVETLRQSLGWPVLADALSPCRHHGGEVLATYDTFLRSEAVAEQVRPAAVIQLGDLPTSKVLRSRLAAWQVPTWIVDPAPDSRNAVAAPAVAVRCAVEELEVESAVSVSTLARAEASETSATWAAQLQAVEAETRTGLNAALATAAPSAEAGYAVAVLTSLPAKTPIFVASSMPVRDAEYLWEANAAGRPIYFNRGANGIDGTLSSALGMAEASRLPSVLYTGELALLHDANGLLVAGTAFAGSLTIVCINNEGGGIFEHLPVAALEDVFEPCFGTPQRVDFGRWAGAFGIDYQLIENPAALRAALAELPLKGVRLLEVRTDRKADATWRKATFARIAEGLEKGAKTPA